VNAVDRSYRALRSRRTVSRSKPASSSWRTIMPTCFWLRFCLPCPGTVITTPDSWRKRRWLVAVPPSSVKPCSTSQAVSARRVTVLIDEFSDVAGHDAPVRRFRWRRPAAPGPARAQERRQSRSSRRDARSSSEAELVPQTPGSPGRTRTLRLTRRTLDLDPNGSIRPREVVVASLPRSDSRVSLRESSNTSFETASPTCCRPWMRADF